MKKKSNPVEIVCAIIAVLLFAGMLGGLWYVVSQYHTLCQSFGK